MGRESLNSMNRKQKLSYLGEDYGSYLQQFQGIFTVRCQIMYSELMRWKDTIELSRRMKEFHTFKKL